MIRSSARSGLAAMLALHAGCSGDSADVRLQRDLSPRARIIEPVAARVSDDSMYIRFAGALEDELELEFPPTFHVRGALHRDESLATPAEFLDAEAWEEATVNARDVAVLEVDSFDDVVETLFDALVPAERGQGAAFRIGERQYLLYFDEDDDLQVVPFLERPDDIELSATHTAADVRSAALEAMALELAEHGLRAAVLRSQEYGPGATPFVYVDLDAEHLIMLEFRLQRAAAPLETAGMVGDAGIHLVARSFFIDLYCAPVSMIWRGGFLVGTTAVDVANPADWDRTPPESIPPLYEGEPMDLAAFDAWLDTRTPSIVVPGRVERILLGGDDDPRNYPIRILETEPQSSTIFRGQIEAMRRARRFIWIENLYFSNALFLHELVDARQRGVAVRVIMPCAGNHGLPTKSAVVTANRLLAAGIRVYLYPRITHVKAAVYDGWACYGSANFDKLSFPVNTEINIAYHDEAAVGELLDRIFLPDFETAVELTEPIPEVGWRNSLSERIVDLALWA